MKKHNEGYVLPLVMVVMVILSLIAVGVMSVSLRNLKTQRADVVRMQERHAVQGELEKKVAALSALQHNEKYSDFTGNGQAQAQAEGIISAVLGTGAVIEKWDIEGDACHCTVTFLVEEGSTVITCTLRLENFVVKDTESGKYLIYAPDVVYTSYEIGGGGNG